MQLVTGKKKPLVKRFAHAFRQDVGAWVLMLPSLILFIFFVWQPLVNGLILSLFETKGFLCASSACRILLTLCRNRPSGPR